MENHHRWQAALLGGSVLLASATFCFVAFAKLTGVPGSSTTTFKVPTTVGMVVEGRTPDMSVADDGTTITITVPLGNLETGIGLRNQHTKNALDVATYPTAVIKVARSALTFPAAGAESSGDAKGALTIHGQTRDETFHYSAKLNGSTLDVRGSTSINMNNYGVKPPSYVGVGVKPNVDITTVFQAIP